MTTGIYILSWPNYNGVYIGQSLNIHKRKLHHIWSLRKECHCNSKLQAIFKKRGIPDHSILEEVIDPKLLDIKEQSWIDEFSSITNGLNISSVDMLSGGNYPNGKYTRLTILKAFRKLLNPKNTIKNISAELNINTSTLRAINSGQEHLWIKYKYPFLYQLLQDRREERNSYSRSTEVLYSVISPDNTEYTIDNIAQFCKLHTLNIGNFHSMLTGKFKTCKKWRLSSTKDTRQEYTFKCPTGKIYRTKYLNEFAEEHGLDKSSVYRVAIGEYKSSKGWILVSQV